METMAIGERLELLVDDQLIDKSVGEVRFVLHHPMPREEALVWDAPWERNSGHLGYMTVFKDDDLYRMYYGVRQRIYQKGAKKIDKEEQICYAESYDGVHWERPSLQQFSFEGSCDNNICWTEDGVSRKGIHGFAPFKDANPACLQEQRYKAVARGKGGLYAQISEDGIHWMTLSSEPIITQGAFDSQNLAFWDQERCEYRAYWRDFFHTVDGRRMRAIRTASSPDFLNWNESSLLNYPAAELEQMYTNQITPYFRAPHIFVGFPTRYVERPWSKSIEALPELARRSELVAVDGRKRVGPALTDALFMSSRNGVDFQRWDEAFIRPGLRAANNWFYGDNYVNWGLVTTKASIPGAPDEISFYVSEGSRNQHREGQEKVFRRYTLRQDGFVSVNATRRGGYLITKPLVFSGQDLFINFSASAAGSIAVELQDYWGAPLPGYSFLDCVEVLGDDLNRRVEWQEKPNTAELAGQPVRICFRLTDADLYAFRFGI